MTSELNKCPFCGGKLNVQWTDEVNSISLVMGLPTIILHIKQCQNKNCNFIIYPEEYLKLAPLESQYSFDCQTEIGILRLENYQDKDIAEIILNKFGITISRSTISHLANKFIDYFAASHYTLNNEKIRNYLNENGGYILHIDGTCQGDSPMHFLVIDAVNEICLATYKMTSENKEDIGNLLSECVEKYGNPLAIVSDLSDKIKGAIDNVFSEKIPHFICQYHLLENMGKRLFKKDNTELRSLLRKEGLRKCFHDLLQTLAVKNTDKLLEQDELVSILENPNTILKKGMPDSIIRSLTFTLLKWCLDYKTELNGEYYPFAKSEFELIKRYRKVYDLLKNIIEKEKSKKKENKEENVLFKLSSLNTLFEKLDTFFKKEAVNECMKNLKNSDIIFTKVRAFFKMQSEAGAPMTRMKINLDIDTPQKQETNTEFLENLIEEYKEQKEFTTAINGVKFYFEKYTKELSGHNILNKNEEYINVFRTNNLLEHFFGKFKRNLRKRVGNWNLKRQITHLHPQAMLVVNLLNKKYLEIIECDNIRDISLSFVNLKNEANTFQDKRKEKSKSKKNIPMKTLRKPNFIGNFEIIFDFSNKFLFKSNN